jgi:hypothetical protein
MNQAIASETVSNKAGILLRAGGESAPLPDDHPNSQANIDRRYANKLVERNAQGQLLKGSVVIQGGRPKGVTVTTLARTYTDRAIDLLGKVMDDERAPQAARVTAAQALLDRGWGKAPIQIDLNVRAKFDDFLRDVGLAANYERDHPVVDEQHGQQTVEDIVIKGALDEEERKENEQDGAE